MRATDTLFSTTAQFQILRAPTSSNGTTFGPGSANNLLKSNGTSVYWTTLAASDIPNLSTDKLTSGTLGVARGGTGQTSIANIQAGKDGDGNTISSTYLKLSGGTMTGQIVLASTGFKTNSANGYSLDGYGNFQHLSNVTSDYFHFNDSKGTAKLSIYWETGNVTAVGTITAPTFSGSLNGNAATATKFASSQSITLTGDTTGTVSSQAGWSITTKTDRLSTVGDNRSVATTPNNYANKIIFQGLKNKSNINNPSNDVYSYVIGLRGWADYSGGKAHEFAFNDSGINHRIGLTTSWENWEKIITSGNYTDYTVTKTGSGASGTWGINVTGTAANVTGTVAIEHGGTGATTTSGARTNLDLGNVENTKLSTWTGSTNITTLGTITNALTIKNIGNVLTIKQSDNSYAYALAFESYNAGTSGRISCSDSFYFSEYSKNTSTNQYLSHKEFYYLPTCDDNLNTDKGYDILTSKNAVTIGQGGTGATTAAGARSNLGITPANIGALASKAVVLGGSEYAAALPTGQFELGILVGQFRDLSDSSHNGYSIVFVYNGTAYMSKKFGLDSTTAVSYSNGTLTVNTSVGYMNYAFVKLM